MSAEHQQAAARRLAELSTQLEAERAGWERDDDTRELPAVPALRLVGPVTTVEEEQHVEPAARGPAPVPMPGRHAARRAPLPGERTAGLGELVPETLRGRIGLGPTHLAVVALLVAVGAVAVAWFVVRGDPAAPVPVAAEVAGESPAASTPPLAAGLDAESGAATGEAAAPGAGATAAAGTVTVDVAGKVRRPGIVVLDTGSRVVDALAGAGGARPGTDLVGINLARILVDGEQIVVGAPGGAVVAPPISGSTGAVGGSTSGTPAAPGGLVDLNLATQAELEELPNVGPVTATAIITWREGNGGFTAVTELLEVDGIGDKTLEQLTPLVTV